MKLPLDEYDFVTSLGGNCNVALQLNHRGKRSFSLPLDWTLMYEDRPIKWLPEGIRNHFAGFCLRENLKEYEPPIMEKGKKVYHYIDEATGFRFTHHFYKSVENEAAYKKVKAVIDRRIERFYRKVSTAECVLFVLETSFTYDIKHAQAIYESLKGTFPSTRIDMVVMQFRAAECRELYLEDGHLVVAQYERHMNIVYDNQFTAPEWMWMDGLRIKGMPLPEERRKKSLFIKWKYKLWVTIGKSLEADGAGCANMRFKAFDRYE